MKKIVLILFMTFICQLSQSQHIMKFGEMCNGNFETLIDNSLSMCLVDSNTVMGDCACYLVSYDQWQIEIDKYYTIIVKKTNGNIRDGIIKSQDNWVKYRDSEYESSYSYYRDFGNERIDIYNYHIRIVDLNRKRAMELQLYCSNLNLN